MPARFMPTESLEDEIRRLRGPGEAPDVDEIVREAGAPTATPTPTPPPQEAFEAVTAPTATLPAPPTGMERFREKEQELQPDNPLQMLHKVASEKGIENYAAPFYAAVGALQEQDSEPMFRLATEANQSQNENLQRAIGDFLPFSVPFDSLSEEMQDGVVRTSPAWLTGTASPLPEGVKRVLRRNLRGDIGPEGWPYQEVDATRAIEDLRKNEDFLAMPTEEQLYLERLLEGNEYYKQSEFFDAEDYQKVYEKVRFEPLPEGMSMFTIVALAALPFTPAAGLGALIPTAAAPLTMGVVESVTGGPTAAKIAVALTYLAGGGVAGAVGGARAANALKSVFSTVYPELGAQLVDPRTPLDDRIITAIILGTPVLAHFGGMLNSKTLEIKARTAETNWVRQLQKVEQKTGDLVDAFVVPEEGLSTYHGTTATNFAGIATEGFRGNGTHSTTRRTGAEAAARVTGELEQGGGGAVTVNVTLRPGIRLLKVESETGINIFLEASARYSWEAESLRSQGKEVPAKLKEHIATEIIRDRGYDGVYDAGREFYWTFDPRDSLVKGLPDPKLPTENALIEAYGGEKLPDLLQTEKGLLSLPELPKLGDKTPAEALTEARAQLDWLAKSSLFLGEHVPGYRQLASIFASGQKAFQDPLFLGVEEHALATRAASNWATVHGNHIANVFDTAFGKGKRTADAVGAKGTDTFAIQLQDGKWYPFNSVVTQPSRFPLTESQRSAILLYDKTNRALTEMQREQGLRPIELAKGEEVWFPRRVVPEDLPGRGPSAKRPGAKSSTERHRLYERQLEGEKLGTEYWDDYRTLIRDNFYAKIMSVADNNLSRWIDFYAETQLTRMNRLHTDLVRGLEEARRDIPKARTAVHSQLWGTRNAALAIVTSLRKQVARARESVKLETGKHRIRVQKQVRAVERITLTRARARLAALEAQLVKAEMAAKAIPKVTKERVEISGEVIQAKARYGAIKMEYQHAWDRLFRHVPKRDRLGRTIAEAERLGGPEMPLATGKIMSAKRYNELRRAYEPVDMGMIGNFLTEIQAPFRMIWASLDNSAALLTLGLVAEAHPAAWGTIMGLATKSMFRGGYFERWVLSNPGLLERSGRYGLMLRVNELVRPMGRETKFTTKLREVPVIGQAWKASDFMFTTTGDIARLHMWRLWEGQWRATWGEKGLYQLADHINRITGVTKAGHPIESIVLFAPKFFRALMSIPANTIRGGPVGHGARVFMTRLFLTATALTVAGNMLQGEPYNLNITDIGQSEKEREGRPPPFAVRSVTGWFYVLGPFEPIAKMFARLARGEVEEVVGRSLRGKLGPAGEEVANWMTGRDFMGEKVPNLKDPLEVIRYISENMAPFAGKQIIEQMKVAVEIEGAVTPKTLAMAAPNVIGEFFGVRATPQFIGEAINERTRHLVEQVRAGEFEIDEKLKADIEEHHEDYFVYGNLPDDIRDAFKAGDENLTRLLDLRENRALAQETEFSGLLNLRNEQTARLETLGQQLDQGWKPGPEGEHIPYNRKDYKSDVDDVVEDVRTRMEQYKKDEGIEDENLLEKPGEYPDALLIMEEYIQTVVEPAIDPVTGKLDGETYEMLYGKMEALHQGEMFAPGVTVMERVDMLLTSKDDPHYKQMKEDMRQLQPFFSFRDSAWSPEFIKASEEVTWIAPEVARQFRTPYEFQTALELQLTDDLRADGDNTGFGSWGNVMFDKTEGVTFAQEYGERPAMSGDKAEAIARNLVDRVMVEFWTARSDATKWWFRNKRPDLLPIANRWVYDTPAVLVDLLD